MVSLMYICRECGNRFDGFQHKEGKGDSLHPLCKECFKPIARKMYPETFEKAENWDMLENPDKLKIFSKSEFNAFTKNAAQMRKKIEDFKKWVAWIDSGADCKKCRFNTGRCNVLCSIADKKLREILRAKK